MVGERWNLNIEKAWNSRPIPHVEDMQTSPVSMIENIGLKGVAEFVKTQDLGNRFTNGELAETFEGCLHLEGTKIILIVIKFLLLVHSFGLQIKICTIKKCGVNIIIFMIMFV